MTFFRCSRRSSEACEIALQWTAKLRSKGERPWGVFWCAAVTMALEVMRHKRRNLPTGSKKTLFFLSRRKVGDSLDLAPSVTLCAHCLIKISPLFPFFPSSLMSSSSHSFHRNPFPFTPSQTQKPTHPLRRPSDQPASQARSVPGRRKISFPLPRLKRGVKASGMASHRRPVEERARWGHAATCVRHRPRLRVYSKCGKRSETGWSGEF